MQHKMSRCMNRTPWTCEGSYNLVHLVVEHRDDCGQPCYLNKRTGQSARTLREILSDDDFQDGARLQASDRGSNHSKDVGATSSRPRSKKTAARGQASIPSQLGSEPGNCKKACLDGVEVASQIRYRSRRSFLTLAVCQMICLIVGVWWFCLRFDDLASSCPLCIYGREFRLAH